MNIMIAAAGISNVVPAGGTPPGLIFIGICVAVGVALLSGANRLARRGHRRHAVRYASSRH